jgi:hypothetical protein
LQQLRREVHVIAQPRADQLLQGLGLRMQLREEQPAFFRLPA